MRRLAEAGSGGCAGAAARILAAALLWACAAGCAPGNPLDARVDAANSLSFSMWRADAAGRLSPEQVGDFNEALQQIRFQIMAESRATGSDAVEEALRQSIDGRTVLDVLRSGFGWELKQSEAERSDLEDSLKKNALMTTRPGDTASANYLSDLRDRQTVRFRAAVEQVAHVKARMAAAGLPAGPPGDAPTPSP